MRKRKFNSRTPGGIKFSKLLKCLQRGWRARIRRSIRDPRKTLNFLCSRQETCTAADMLESRWLCTALLIISYYAMSASPRMTRRLDLLASVTRAFQPVRDRAMVATGAAATLTTLWRANTQWSLSTRRIWDCSEGKWAFTWTAWSRTSKCRERWSRHIRPTLSRLKVAQKEVQRQWKPRWRSLRASCMRRSIHVEISTCQRNLELRLWRRASSSSSTIWPRA